MLERRCETIHRHGKNNDTDLYATRHQALTDANLQYTKKGKQDLHLVLSSEAYLFCIFW